MMPTPLPVAPAWWWAKSGIWTTVATSSPIKGGVRHEFMGDQKVTVNGIKFTNDLRGTRGYYGAGFDLQFASNARIYAEFEREDGQKASTPWSVSAGLRVEF